MMGVIHSNITKASGLAQLREDKGIITIKSNNGFKLGIIQD